MPRLRKFESISAAVVHVCSGKIGPFSSGETLENKVRQHLSQSMLDDIQNHATPFRTRCIQERNLWRKREGINGDCRTYATQHRRDMLNDEKLDISAINDIKGLLDAVTSDQLVKTLRKFHSIDQLNKAVNHVVELDEYIDLSTLQV